MSGVHDMGGLECYGPIEYETDEKFHNDWERQVLAITLAMGATGTWNLDQSRFSRESLEPSDYLSIGYYRIWLKALESLLLQHELVTQHELETGRSYSEPKQVKRVLKATDVAAVLKKGGPVSREVSHEPRFSIGDVVRVKNIHTPKHTRLPSYIRNHVGIVHAIHGAHVYPDAHAQGLGEDPQWLYNIKFQASELFGVPRSQHDFTHADCWEPYLEIHHG